MGTLLVPRSFQGAVLAAAALACATPSPAPDQGDPAAPALRALKADIRDQTLTGLTTEVHLLLENPGPVEVTAASARWEVVMDGTVMARGETPLSATASPGGSAPIVLRSTPITVATTSAELQRRAEAKTLPVVWRGAVTASGGGKTWTLDFSRATEARTPRLPVVTLQGYSVARGAEQGISLTFSIHVENTNAFEVPVSGLTCTLSVGGKSMGERATARNDKLPRSAAAVWDISTPLNDETFGPDLARRIKKGDLDYEIEGTLDLGIIQLPVKLAGPLAIHQ